jgi:hypothetical protein
MISWIACFSLTTLSFAFLWWITRMGPARKARELEKRLMAVEAATKRSLRTSHVATAQATQALDERDTAIHDLIELRDRCLQLAERWDALAPAPCAYRVVAGELRRLLALGQRESTRPTRESREHVRQT